jgi:mannitol/fructose-specific phosphotransferase system IIA component (Ntr-type)
LVLAARPELVFTDLPGDDREAILRDLANRLEANGCVRDGAALYDELIGREHLGSTAVGGRVAIPHAKIKGLRQPVLAVGLSRQGVDFAAPDGLAVRVFFVVLSPSDAPAEHLRTLAAISRWLDPRAGRAAGLVELHDRDRVCELLRTESP